MEFLYDTKRVSLDAFDEAMEDAATYPWSELETIAFLCRDRCSSRRAVTSAFKATRSFTMIKYLYETKRISKETIIDAFKREARSIWYTHDEDQVQIVKLLYKEKCISPEVIGEALVIAARQGKTEVVELLRVDPRIRVEVLRHAFVAAADQTNSHLMRSLYVKQQITSDALSTAFVKAADRGRLKVGRQDVLQLVGSIDFGYCTRGMRKKMLQVATTDAAKRFAQEILDVHEL
ncbi:hypothetical protein PI124_g14167 [Phytophthora idaei]|nr:hypothetical protein PI125_g12860 [Phytophthora idaei]KAG3149624.1 hypothetical protein PI126_g11925 [Phytophthora idaei]KAG3240939.1 hypothetical protein PI124_g14167 [Phytophthora idaei]